MDPTARALLRLGSYQLMFTRIPDHAAVSETVDLASARHRGFVNAVLRRLAREDQRPLQGAGVDDVSGRTGLARWAVAELGRLLPPAEVEPAALALASPSSLSLRVNRCRVGPDSVRARLGEAGFEVSGGRHHRDVLKVPGAIPALLPGFAEGWFAVQDEASALVADAVGARPGERLLDACAAPGGKAIQLACQAGPGSRVVAADVHPGRTALISDSARRLGAPLSVLVQDARRPATAGPFDAALVDAPCSGLGAARRRPELLWRVSPSRLATLARLQVAILVATAGLLRPGGRLVYSVCTFPRAETDAAVRAFLAKRPDFEPNLVPGPDGPAFSHRLWPHRHDTDAMFYAGFVRR
jgi:16S rRNA (cytosine967-C5)-methyltransferase